jgi:hypothetical protein
MWGSRTQNGEIPKVSSGKDGRGGAVNGITTSTNALITEYTGDPVERWDENHLENQRYVDVIAAANLTDGLLQYVIAGRTGAYVIVGGQTSIGSGMAACASAPAADRVNVVEHYAHHRFMVVVGTNQQNMMINVLQLALEPWRADTMTTNLCPVVTSHIRFWDHAGWLRYVYFVSIWGI